MKKRRDGEKPFSYLSVLPERMEIGALPDADGGARFTVWAPLKEKMELVIVSDGNHVVPMNKDSRGYWHTQVTGAKRGLRYLYRIDSRIERPDPCSFSQPDGVHGPSEYTGLGAAKFSATSFRPVKPKDMIIMEIHVGTFTAEGTFDAAAKRLDYLKKAGINAVEIMPVAQFPGARNWGYDGVYPFAAQNSYGGPAGLTRFVGECHKKGIPVILDVVYNHLGPEGNYLADFAPYFTDKYRTPWGSAVNYDDAYSCGVRNYFAENALHWFEKFGVDTLRVDAIHGIHDEGAVHILAEIAAKTAALEKNLGRDFYLIAESDLNDSRTVRPLSDGGLALDGQWSDDYHHALHTILTGERNGYYEDFGRMEDFVSVYKNGVVYDGKFSFHRKRFHGNSYAGVRAEQLVVFAQNHDQTGNRLGGERLSSLTDFESLKLAAAAVILSPFVPLFFMGEEYGEDAPFLYFTSHGDEKLVEAVRSGREREFRSFGWKTPPADPQDEATFAKSKINPEKKLDAVRHKAVFGCYRELIKLRRTRGEFAADFSTIKYVGARGMGVTVLRKKGASGSAILFNFSTSPTEFDRITGNSRRTRRKIFDSADKKWHGPGEAKILARMNGRVVLPPRSVVVFADGN